MSSLSEGTPPARPAAGPDRHRWWGLVAISLGVSLIIVDSTIVNVAVPSIIDDLGITSSDAQWVQESYTLVFAALLLLAGRTADRLGRRRVFLTGVLVFMAASVLAATAGSGPALIGSRLLQGVGGAMILPTSLSLINATFRGGDRGKAFAIWGSTIGGTAALGPLLGGWLTADFSWRWAFGINIPFGLLVLGGALAFLPESRDRSGDGGVDLPGALLSVVGFTGIVFGLIEGRTYGWWRLEQPFHALGLELTGGLSPVPAAFAAGAVALAAFAAVEVRRNRAGRPAMLDLRLFRIPTFRNGNVVAGVVSLGEFGLLFSLPLWLQNVLGYSALQAGVALLPLAIGSFVASGLGAVLGQRVGTVNVVIAGIALELVGVAGVGVVAGPDTSGWAVAPFLFLYGAGVGWATAQITGITLSDVPVEQSGQGSGIQSTARQIGSALGIAVLGTVLFTSLESGLSDSLTSSGTPAPQAHATARLVRDTAGSAIPALERSPGTRPAADRARTALSDATSWAAYSAAAALGLGLAAALRLRSTLPDHGRPQRPGGAPAPSPEAAGRA
ncbi:MFS transporter [Streptacidiphilus sp. ASG 303]|uniref:MFS transporter n=1 Tax=Streptacidiphilus sp. ASG 303 TaxID=2896847 RepID=UPI001E29827D|nr:MFS transporter [Streptacidiphilus sp. ASG 303]MCD0480849.1 MFS transporter [Streptacidiphilus sp. ASG 303]